MVWLDGLIEKWRRFSDKLRPGYRRVRRALCSAGQNVSALWRYIYWFRAVILAAPVAATAVVLAVMNLNRLPEMVEVTKIAIDAKAESALLGFLVIGAEAVPRAAVVYGPLLVTAVCLLLTLCSKRTLYPWIISVFSLCLPVMIYLFNTYPM